MLHRRRALSWPAAVWVGVSVLLGCGLSMAAARAADDPAGGATADAEIDYTQFTFLQALSSDSNLFGVTVSGDGQRIAAFSNGALQLWQVADGARVATLTSTTVSCERAALNADGSTAYLWDSTGHGETMNVATGVGTPTRLPTGNIFRNPLDNADPILRLTGENVQGAGEEIQLVDRVDHRVLGRLPACEAILIPAWLIAIVPQDDDTFSLVRMNTRTGTRETLAAVIAPRMDAGSAVNTAGLLQATPDGQAGIWCDRDGGIHRWNFQTGQEIGAPITTDRLHGAGLNAAGTQVVVLERPGDLRLLDFAVGRERARFEHCATAVELENDFALRFTPDGRAIYFPQRVVDGYVYVFLSARTGEWLLEVAGSPDWKTWDGSILPAGRFFAVTGGSPSSLEIWGPDPHPPPVNRDPLILAELGRQGLRNTLFEVVINGTADDVTARIRAHPEELKQTDKVARTPLFYAIETGRIDVVRALLDAGADPNFESDISGYPLLVATYNRNLTIMDLLWEHGARVKLEDQHFLWSANLRTKLGGKNRGVFTGLQVQQRPEPTSRVRLATWLFDHQIECSPTTVRWVVDSLQHQFSDPAAASYVYHRAAWVDTLWLVLLQILLIAAGMWRIRAMRPRAVAVKTAAINAAQTRDEEAPVPPVAADGWGDSGHGGPARLTADQAAELALRQGRLRSMRIAILTTLFGSLPVALLPLVNGYWFDHDINQLIWLPVGAFGVWACSYIRWTWVRLLTHLTGVIGGGIGVAGGFIGGNSSAEYAPPDRWLAVLCVIMGLSALPMIVATACNLPSIWQLRRLEKIAAAAQTAARRVPEEDLGATPGWDREHRNPTSEKKAP